MTKLILTALIFMALTGCAEMFVKDISPQEAKTESTLKLCARYGGGIYGSGGALSSGVYAVDEVKAVNKKRHTLINIKNELLRRKAFTKEEWKLIENRTIKVGMSSTALTCAIGYPDHINRASYGNQAMYKTGKYSHRYVYTKNGIVTAWN